MFELNNIFIRKTGWSEYSGSLWRPPISFKNVPGDFNIIYYIQPKNSEKTFLITKYLDKQNSIVEYKFISIQGNTKDLDFNNKLNEVKIGSNLELMKIVYDFEACNEDYQRHFKLNKLLK